MVPIGGLSAHGTALPNESEASITGPAHHTVQLSARLTDDVSVRRRFRGAAVEGFPEERVITA